MDKNKFYKYTKTLLIIFSFIFLYKNSKENYQSVLNNLNIDYQNNIFINHSNNNYTKLTQYEIIFFFKAYFKI